MSSSCLKQLKLEDTDSERRMPLVKGYTFGRRLNDSFPKSSTTPSPLDYSPSSFNRFGKFTSPAYTIKSKGNCIQSRNQTPSPMDYQPINTFLKLKPSKSFSFGNRVQTEIKSTTPPPNQYNVPSTIGNHVPDKKKLGRAYSIRGRARHVQEKSTTPGPGAYDPVSLHLYKKKQPSATVTGRRTPPFVPADPHLPGPSQYDTLGCKIDMIKGTCAPRAPFGIRHSPKKFTVFTNADIVY